MKQDLTKGKVLSGLMRFALPVLGANLLQSFYSVVDMAIVGRLVGSAGLAAVSSAAMIGYMIQSICTGITTGGAVLIAQYKGAADEQGQMETTGTLFALSGAAALFLTLISLLAYPGILRSMQVPAEAMGYAMDYMQVMVLGTVFVFGYNAVCSVMRGLGDSKSPLLFVAIASAVNVLLDLILVGPLGLGTRGAALATVASQAVSFGAAVCFLKKKTSLFHFQPGHFRLKAEKCRMILKIGLPSAVQMAVVNLSYLLVTGMLNGYGIAVAAGAGAGLKINTFAAMPCWAVGQGVTTMAGQNMGAGLPERAGKTAKAGLILAMMFSVVTVAGVLLGAERMISLFDPDLQVVKEGALYLRICCTFNFSVYTVMYIFDSFATGIGDSFFAMGNALLQSVLLRVVVSWVLAEVFGMGYIGIYWAECISPVIPAAMGAIYFLKGGWKKRNLVRKDAEK